MTLINATRCKETSTTTGTGTYSLAGASTGFRTLVSGVGTGNHCEYVATDGTDWEHNVGLVTDATPDTIARTLLIASSTGSAINWGAGTRNIFAAESHRPSGVRFLGRRVLSVAGNTCGPIVFPLRMTHIWGIAFVIAPGVLMPRLLFGDGSIDTGTNYAVANAQPNANAIGSTALVGFNLHDVTLASGNHFFCIFMLRHMETVSSLIKGAWQTCLGSVSAATAPVMSHGSGSYNGGSAAFSRIELHGYSLATGSTNANMSAGTELTVYGAFEPQT